LGRLAELGRIQFTSTVQDYTERFTAILCHAKNLDSSQKGDLFVGGLPDHIRVNVELRAPRDIPTAVYLARSFELRATALTALRPLDSQRSGRPQQQRLPPPAARPALPPPALPAGGAPPAAAAAQPPIRQFRRLTPAEQLERRRQGLCYNCDEPFVCGHQCKRLFYLESSDYTDDTDGLGDEEAASDAPVAVDALANALVVSLHALAGIRTENTMVVSVKIKGQ